jgi:uncharacterized protein DUF4232
MEHPSHTIVGVLVVLVVLAGLSACQSSSHPTAGPSTAPITSSSTTSAARSVAATPRPTTTPTTTPPTTATSLPPAIDRCRTSDLTVVLADRSGAAGTFYSELQFRNDSGSTCEMTGYPGVSFLDGSGAQIGVPARRTGAAYSQVDLAPSANAYAALAVPDPDVVSCPTATAQFVRVFPPNETRPVLIRADGMRVCARQTPPGSIDPIAAHPRY